MNEAQLLIEYAKAWNNLDVSYLYDILTMILSITRNGFLVPCMASGTTSTICAESSVPFCKTYHLFQVPK